MFFLRLARCVALMLLLPVAAWANQTIYVDFDRGLLQHYGSWQDAPLAGCAAGHIPGGAAPKGCHRANGYVSACDRNVHPGRLQAYLMAHREHEAKKSGLARRGAVLAERSPDRHLSPACCVAKRTGRSLLATDSHSCRCQSRRSATQQVRRLRAHA